MTQNNDFLKDVLVLTVKKSYWASPESRVFPHQLYSWVLRGHSQDKRNAFIFWLRSLLWVFVLQRPKLIFFGSAHRIIPWYVRLKKWGLLPKTKLIATHQVYFPDESLPYIDKVILTSGLDIANRVAVNQQPHKYVRFPYHADGDYSRYDTTPADYIFSGGRASRDYPTLIEAVRGLDVRLKIITHKPEYLGYTGELPPNVEVLWQMPLEEFLAHAARSLFVVVPLLPKPDAHGVSTIVQAMSLGKALISTEDSTSPDYIEQGKTGLLVPSGDPKALRDAIQSLLDNPAQRQEMERNARHAAQKFSYAAYTQNIIHLCREVLGLTPP